MKKTLLKSALFITTASVGIFSTTYADSTATNFSTCNAGFVVGVQGGYADTHWKDAPYFNVDGTTGTSLTPIFDVKGTGFAARGFLGYDFNQYFGAEAGYTYLPSAKVNFANGVDQFKIKNYAVDLLGKLSVPVTNVFKVYAKAGGSYLNASGAQGASGSVNHIGPAFGVGAAYEIIPNLSIDASWMRFGGNSNPNGDKYMPSPDVFLVGASYKFPVNIS